MSDREMVDKIFETMVHEALEEVEQEDAYPSCDNFDFEFSEQHKEKMKKIFDREKKKIWIRKFGKSMQRVAAGLLVVILVSGVAVMSVSAWRVKFLNFIFDTKQTNTEITTNEDTNQATYNTDLFSLHYIPEGFSLEKQMIAEDLTYLKFSDSVNDFIISITPLEGKVSLDTENAYCEKININDNEALYSETDTENILVIENREEIISIKSSLKRDEIIKIAQNLKIK